MHKTFFAGAGGLIAALLGSLCCVEPILFVTLGIGAGLATTFEPLRPVFGLLMVGLFALAFYRVYGRPASHATAASSAPACEIPRSRRREKVILWIAVGAAALLWTFPTWSTWLL